MKIKYMLFLNDTVLILMSIKSQTGIWAFGVFVLYDTI